MVAAEQLAAEARKALVAELFDVRTEITEIEERALRPLKQRRAQIEAELMFILQVDESIGFTGVGTVKMVEEVVPRVYDWQSLFEYIKLNDRLDLLPARINAIPFRDIINVEGSLVGVEPTTVRKLRVRKS